MDDRTMQLLTEMRRVLHANPELSEHEGSTQDRIMDFLKEHSKARIQKVAHTGVLAIFEGNELGRSIMIRGDIDALPIQESNTFEYRSKRPGVSHKCGHDGHTVILLGLAIQLTRHVVEKGKVILLFQPAEENGMGAQAVVDDTNFDEDIDFVFALHNLPGYSRHDVVIKENEFTANVKSIIIKLKGKTAHAAEPEFGHNPAGVVADILSYAQEFTNNDPEDAEFFLITPVYASLGDKAYGISAGYAEVHLTLRSWSTELMDVRCSELEQFVIEKCQDNELIPEISYTQVFHANMNHPEAVDIIRTAAKSSGQKLVENLVPFKWGEDFGLFTQRYKGAMFGIGAGKDTPALHNPDYDFPDEIIPTGVDMFYQLIKEVLNK